MANKKKAKKKSTGSKKSSGRKAAAKRPAPKKKASKKTKAVPKKAASKKKALARTTGAKTEVGIKKQSRSERRRPSSFPSTGESSGLQSGDLQGLSNAENVDSESVDELLEEGNAFEAGVVSGVEDSREREGSEVRTREVPEDDVPGEYLDEQ